LREIGPNLYGLSYAHVVTTDPQDNRALRHSDFGATTTESTGDRWDSSNYNELLQQLKDTMETATTANCKEVLIPASQTIGSNDSHEEWRGGPTASFQP